MDQKGRLDSQQSQPFRTTRCDHEHVYLTLKRNRRLMVTDLWSYDPEVEQRASTVALHRVRP